MNIALKDVDNIDFNGINIDIVKFNETEVWRKNVTPTITTMSANFGATSYENVYVFPTSEELSASNVYNKIGRCTVADDGTIIAKYGDNNYTEDGSNGQVMVYIPKFYYKYNKKKI
jgi:hypothetical protein